MTIPSTAASSSSIGACTSRDRSEIMDKIYADTGVEQGRAVLSDLARHPATATHVATKLARHFVADEPSPALVERLAEIFRDTDGDLKEVAKGSGRRAGGLGADAEPSSSGRASG